MQQLSRLRGLVAALALAGLAGCASTGSSTSEARLDDPRAGSGREQRAVHEFSGEVYLLRGLANVFSTGLDTLNGQFLRRGVNSRVDNHAVWQRWADDIIARSARKQVSYPIVIMGHSLGSNAAGMMAEYLGKAGVPVAYVAQFDGTETTRTGPNMGTVDNFYLPHENPPTNITVDGAGYTGKSTNIDVSTIDGINHFNIEKNPQLQARVIARTMVLLKPKNTEKAMAAMR